MRHLAIYIVCFGALFAMGCHSEQIEPSTNDEQIVNTLSSMPKSAKRGVAFSFTEITDLPLLTPYISWDYNWGNTTTENAALWFDNNEVDFCPMCWNGSYSADRIRQFVIAHPNTKYLLAFNEPNLTDQANMTPKQAAEQWSAVKALATELNLKIVSPAMNYGTLAGYHDPIKWLDEFFACDGVSIDDVSAISIHCYQANTGGIKTMVENMSKYGKPIWVTEFCAWEYGIGPASADAQMYYMSSMLNYMETATQVERYAWFMPRTNLATDAYPYNQLLTKTKPYTLTPLGRLYCQFSSFDESVWLTTSSAIQAKDYVGISGNDVWVMPSSDDDDLLMIYAFHLDQWTEYQVYCENDKNTMQIRYATIHTPIVDVYIDEIKQTSVTLPATGADMNTWSTFDVPLNIKQGKHTIRIEMTKSTMHFAWWQLN